MNCPVTSCQLFGSVCSTAFRSLAILPLSLQSHRRDPEPVLNPVNTERFSRPMALFGKQVVWHANKTVEKMVKWPKNEMLLNIQNQTIDRKSLDNSLFICILEYLTFKLEDFHEWTEIHRDLHWHNPRANSKNVLNQTKKTG